jgi:radical SAM superfamily enzyme YgiQ (UPF0313 family)
MYNMPPLGLINLATVLKATQHTTRIFDFPLAIRQKTLLTGEKIYEECARQVVDFEPHLACFSVQCTTYPPALMIAEELKKLRPRIKIVFGGHNASFVDEATLSRFPQVDAIVRGEGELTFPELVDGLDDKVLLRDVPGITFREGVRIVRNPDRRLIEDLNSLPVSDYTFVAPLQVYRDVCGLQRSIAILEIGRGCPHHCIYCSQSLIWKRKARTFSVSRLIGEMKSLSENFGAECFLLAYDQFTAKRSFAEEFCCGVIEAGLHHIPWYCISRLDTVDGPLLDLMREAGCETMCYGIDSGSKKTLAFIRKNIDGEILFQRVRETTERGIVPTLSFVIGFPQEEKDDLDATLRMALKSAVTGNVNILVQMATTLPGTDLHKNYLPALVREVDTYFSLGIEFDAGRRLRADDALIDSSPEIFSSFYNLPCPAAPLAELNKIASFFPIIAGLYPRSFLLLGLEPGRSILELFFEFLRYNEKINGGGLQLTPHDCVAHFESFAASLFQQGLPPVRAYTSDIIKYETCLLKAGRLGAPPSPPRIDPSRMRDFKPLLSEKILPEEFTFDIPSLILEFKFGKFPENYPRRAAYLFFRQLQGEIDIRQINDFGVAFLRLCDGTRNLDAIAGNLYHTYGEKKEREEFALLCAEAAAALADLMLIVPGETADPEKRGGETDARGKGSRKKDSRN